MIPFDDSFFRDAEYLANTPAVSDQGAPTTSYPDTGETVRASLQPSSDVVGVKRTEPDGQVVSMSVKRVFLQSDPAGLNSGGGIKTDDLFRIAGRLYQVAGPAQEAAWTGSVIVLWSVDCVDVE